MTFAAPTAPLEITVHLVDGAHYRFVQKDPAIADRILMGVQPHRMFASDLFMIGDASSLNAFPSHRVVRVDLMTSPMPSHPFPLGVGMVAEITEEECQRGISRCQPDSVAELVPGEPIRRYAEIELTSGAIVRIEVTLAPLDIDSPVIERTTMDQPALLSRIFSTNGLHLARLGGGISILNPAQFARLEVYPDPSLLPLGRIPAGVWEAAKIEEETD